MTRHSLGWVLVATAVVALLAAAASPVSGTPYEGSGCGPAALALFGVSKPADPDAFVPVRPGADYGHSLGVLCESAGFDRLVPGVIVALVLSLAGIVLIRSHGARTDEPQVVAA